MTKFKDLKLNEKLSESQMYTVVKIVGNEVQLKNDREENIVVDKNYVETCLTSASQFTDTKEVSRTEIIDILLKNPNIVMTVNFNKQIKEADVRKEIYELYPNKGGKLLSESEFKKNVNSILKKALEGEPRVMEGFHYSEVNSFGRLSFIDMNIDKSLSRIRQVDPRTVNEIILKGTKYIVK